MRANPRILGGIFIHSKVAASFMFSNMASNVKAGQALVRTRRDARRQDYPHLPLLAHFACPVAGFRAEAPKIIGAHDAANGAARILRQH